VYPTIALRAR